MRVVTDTNIVFSAILHTNSKIANIILQPRSKLNFYSTIHLFQEIQDNKNKLLKLLKYFRFFSSTIINQKSAFLNQLLYRFVVRTGRGEWSFLGSLPNRGNCFSSDFQFPEIFSVQVLSLLYTTCLQLDLRALLNCIDKIFKSIN